MHNIYVYKYMCSQKFVIIDIYVFILIFFPATIHRNAREYANRIMII